MLNVYIDGEEVQASEGESVLEIARRLELATIPSLCYHPALNAEASCRMCVVEVEAETTRLAMACTLKAQDGLRVWTDSEAVRISRKITLSLLLKRSPDSLLLRVWAKRYNLDVPVVTNNGTDPPPDCILCGLCVRACAVLGVEALQFTRRGKYRQVKLIIDAGHSPCIGCRACERLCILQDAYAVAPAGLQGVHNWISSLPKALCTGCGRAYATQAAVNFVKVKAPTSKARIGLCPECKRVASLPAHLRYQAAPDK